MTDSEKVSRKVIYAALRKQFPGADKQALKAMAYDTTREAVKNIRAEQ